MNPKKQIEQLEAKRKELVAEAQAILEVAREEDRELTKAEKARFDQIMDENSDTCLVKQVDEEITHWEQIQDRKAAMLSEESRGTLNAGQLRVNEAQQAAQPMGPLGASRSFAIPVKQSLYSPLAVKRAGFNSAEEAYVAGQFFLAVLGNKPATEWCDRHGIQLIKAQQQIGDDSKGGYLVPTPLQRVLISLIEQFGVMRRYARNHPMTADKDGFPKNATNLEAVPVAELAQMTPTDKTFGRVDLDAEKWGVLVQMSTELDEDSVIDMGAHLAEDMARAHAKAEDNSGFNGDGTGTYNGITGIRNALQAGSIYTAVGKASFAALDLADFEALIGQLPNIAGMNPRWYMHKTGWAMSVLNIADTAPGNTMAHLQGGVMADGATADFQFLGYPGTWVNVMPSKADEANNLKGALIFGDLNLGTIFGDRRRMEVAFSNHFYFDQDAIAVRSTQRFDIEVHETGDATNAGVIVQLDFGTAT